MGLGVRGVISILLWALLVYAAVLIALFAFQRGLMYRPGNSLPSPATTMVPQAQVRVLKTDSGLALTSWYVPPEHGNKAAPVILYFQGNAGTFADRDFKAAPLAAAGYGVWLTGYRGFGGNPGAPDEQGLYADARAAITALAADGVKPAQIVLYGESLGSGVATQMAYELAQAGTPAKGLILEAPFMSMGSAAQDVYFYVPAKWLVRDRYDNLAKIASVQAPLLIMHGDADRVIQQRHGKQLFATAGDLKSGFWPAGGGHSNLYDFDALNEVLGFLKGLK